MGQDDPHRTSTERVRVPTVGPVDTVAVFPGKDKRGIASQDKAANLKILSGPTLIWEIKWTVSGGRGRELHRGVAVTSWEDTCHPGRGGVPGGAQLCKVSEMERQAFRVFPTVKWTWSLQQDNGRGRTNLSVSGAKNCRNPF